MPKKVKAGKGSPKGKAKRSADKGGGLFKALEAQAGYRSARVCRVGDASGALCITDDAVILFSTNDPPSVEQSLSYDQIDAVAVTGEEAPEVTLKLRPPAVDLVVVMEASPLNPAGAGPQDIRGELLPALRDCAAKKGSAVEIREGGAAAAPSTKPPPPAGPPPPSARPVTAAQPGTPADAVLPLLNPMPPPAKKPTLRTSNGHIEVAVSAAACRYARACQKVNHGFGLAERVVLVMRDYVMLIHGEKPKVQKLLPLPDDAGKVSRLLPFDKIEKVTSGKGKDGKPQLLFSAVPPEPDVLLVFGDSPMNATASTEDEITGGLIGALRECCEFHNVPLAVEATSDDLKATKAAKLNKDKRYLPPHELLLRDPEEVKPDYAKVTQARLAAALGAPAVPPTTSPGGKQKAVAPFSFTTPGGPASPGIGFAPSNAGSPLSRGIFDPASPASRYAAAGVYSPVLSPYVLKERPPPPSGPPPQAIVERTQRSKNAARAAEGSAIDKASKSPLGGGLPENTANVHTDAIGKLEAYIDQLKTETQIAELQMQTQKAELREITTAAKKWQELVAQQQETAAEQQRRFNEHLRAVQDQYENHCETAYRQSQRAAEQRLAHQAALQDRNEKQWANVLDALVPCEEDLGDDSTVTSDASDAAPEGAGPTGNSGRVTVKAETSRRTFAMAVSAPFWDTLCADAAVIAGCDVPPLCHVSTGGAPRLTVSEKYFTYFASKWCDRERYCVSVCDPATREWTFHDGRAFWRAEGARAPPPAAAADEDRTPPPPLTQMVPPFADDDEEPPPLDYVLNDAPARLHHLHTDPLDPPSYAHLL
eukprot:TRINITY_DN29875_c0_g1_i1.p1 TRINITY_DN29875_c0_g1~~TRINITY_DN29875_c0_g1_i1.p1  ORF type:complete len:822 (+),score=259.62 TRINITY_DN29875_c0_g1_i1:88-2553(+)